MADKHPGGRPTIFTPELADRICSQLAEGDSMRTVCKSEDMPVMTTIFRWLRENEEFKQQYVRAKEEAADAFIEEMQDIADDGSNDWVEVNGDDKARERYSYNGEHVARSRLRIDTRKWIASKLKPKKYGEKVDLTSGGKALQVTPLVDISSLKKEK